MKIASIVTICIFCAATVKAQQEDAGIKKSISTFFSGMKSNDTLMIKTSLDTTCFLYSIMQNKEGSTMLDKGDINDFLKQVASLKGQNIDERLLSYDIKVDGAMAMAWTPYQLYFNEKLYHCGVNVFTLIKRNNNWKILGITDTRRKKNCE